MTDSPASPPPRKRRRALAILRVLVILGFFGFVLGLLAVGAAYVYVADELPEVDVLKDVQLQVPLRVFTRDGRLIAEYGEQRRVPVHFDQVPPQMIHAFIAAEDDRFFEHPGVDWQGLVRAGVNLVLTGEKEQGGSTITMQVARNFFLSRDKTYVRKIKEIFLSLTIERELSKEQILELYLNKIFLGQRAYGVGAAAEVYFGKTVQELTLPEIAVLAGLPQAPSRDNPLACGECALKRRAYVLHRLRELEYITPAEYETAMAAPLSAEYHGYVVEVQAPYVGEMVRGWMVERHGEAAYTAGYKVITTLDSRLQPAANQALRNTVLDYEQRHGYRGPAGQIELPEGLLIATDAALQAPEAWLEIDAALTNYPVVGGLRPAVVLAVAAPDAAAQTAQVYLGAGRQAELAWEAMNWASPDLGEQGTGPAPETAAEVLAPGDVIYLDRLQTADEAAPPAWRLAQIPEVQAAVVSLDPFDGAIIALAGGFDFSNSKFNRITQSRRQPGSSFKPFIYSAALANGLTPATIINDAPVVFEDEGLGTAWRPENYSGRFYGPTRLREALVHSRNLVSIRILDQVGIGPTLDYLKNFGFDPAQLPHNLSLALGSATLSPLEMARGYAVLANGGFLVAPYFIDRVYGPDERVLYRANPAVACGDCMPAPVPPVLPEKAEPAVVTSDPAVVTPTAEPVASADTETVAADVALQPAPWQPIPYAERTMSPQINYLITDMMHDVATRGTGQRSNELGRTDLAAKTGTTNDFHDAWFSGFNHALVATVWLGYDSARTLGAGEAGARAALPMWVDYMRVALAGVPEVPREQPPGLVTVRIDAETGLRVGAGQPNAVFEIFRAENVPPLAPEAGNPEDQDQEPPGDLF